MEEVVTATPQPSLEGSTPNSRERMLRLAIASLEQGGEVAIRVNDIARNAGVSVTSLYHHFQSREGLIEAAEARRYRELSTLDFERIGQAIANSTSRAEFRHNISAVIRNALNDPERAKVRMTRLEILGSAKSRPSLAKRLVEVHNYQSLETARVLEPLKELGWIRADLDTRAFGLFYLGTMTGRTFVEFGPASVDGEAWNELALSAILAIIPEGD